MLTFSSTDQGPENNARGLTATTIMVSCRPSWDLDWKTPLLDLDAWQSICWMHSREGRSIRWIAKEFGIARKTVSKYLNRVWHF